MGMKQPKGKPKKINGTISSPKEASCYTKIGNAATSAHPAEVKNLRNSNMPEVKSTGGSGNPSY